MDAVRTDQEVVCVGRAVGEARPLRLAVASTPSHREPELDRSRRFRADGLVATLGGATQPPTPSR